KITWNNYLETEGKKMTHLKSYLFKKDVRAQKGEEKVFMRKAWSAMTCLLSSIKFSDRMVVIE
ncbi:hypothetical protein ACVRZD_10135, partial [Streptococcus hongkongensis]